MRFWGSVNLLSPRCVLLIEDGPILMASQVLPQSPISPWQHAKVGYRATPQSAVPYGVVDWFGLDFYHPFFGGLCYRLR